MSGDARVSSKTGAVTPSGTPTPADPWPLPHPACGERRASTEGLGVTGVGLSGVYWRLGVTGVWANPRVSRLPFSNRGHTKVSRQLLATSVTPRRTGMGNHCHLIRRGEEKGMGSPVLYSLNQWARPRPAGLPTCHGI